MSASASRSSRPLKLLECVSQPNQQLPDGALRHAADRETEPPRLTLEAEDLKRHRGEAGLRSAHRLSCFKPREA
jgi:hypothetical protein